MKKRIVENKEALIEELQHALKHIIGCNDSKLCEHCQKLAQKVVQLALPARNPVEIALEEELWSAIEAIAKLARVSVDDVVNVILASYLIKHRAPEPDPSP